MEPNQPSQTQEHPPGAHHKVRHAADVMANATLGVMFLGHTVHALAGKKSLAKRVLHGVHAAGAYAGAHALANKIDRDTENAAKPTPPGGK